MKNLTSLFLFIITLLLFSACELNSEEVSKAPTQPVITRDPVEKAPPIYFTVAPCGYGFRVNGFFGGPGGAPFVDSMSYTIIKVSNNQTVDSSTVFSGANTNWVLTPCTQYKIILHAFITTTTIIATSDGCNGTFIC